MILVKEDNLDLEMIKRWLENTTKDTYDLDCTKNTIYFYNHESDIDDIYLERLDNTHFYISSCSDSILSEEEIAYLFETALEKKCFFETKLLCESKNTRGAGVAYGEIIHHYKNEDYAPADRRFKNLSEIREYAKENPVILVIDSMIGYDSDKLYNFCKGFIINDFSFSEKHYPRSISNYVKDKPVAVIDSALGLCRKELGRVPRDGRKTLFEKFPDDQNYHVEIVGGKKYSVMYDAENTICYDPSKVLLPDGANVRLECKDGTATVCELNPVQYIQN